MENRTQWGVDYLVDMGMTKVVDIKIEAEAVSNKGNDDEIIVC